MSRKISCSAEMTAQLHHADLNLCCLNIDSKYKLQLVFIEKIFGSHGNKVSKGIFSNSQLKFSVILFQSNSLITHTLLRHTIGSVVMVTVLFLKDGENCLTVQDIVK